MEFTEQVIILRVGTFRENDCWVRFFSPSRGMLTAFAFGGRRSRRRFCGCLDNFNQVVFRVRSGKRNQYFSLEEGSLLQGFAALKKDPQKVGMASNCLQFFEAVHVGENGARDAYDLLQSMLEALEGHPGVPSLFFPLLFRIAVAFEQGYRLECIHCASCGSVLQEFLWADCVIEDGIMLCPSCARPEDAQFRLSWQALALLQHLKNGDLKKWVAWNPPSELRRELYHFIDFFVRYHLGIAYEDGRFSRC
ncbi:MAG: DNA repair protein RecO [Desulfoplanes sp.]|nr:DNA repair protein RecO [Desulfoplanes sp.]